MTRRLLATAAFLLLGAMPVYAQTPVTPTQSLAWDHDGVGVDLFKVCVDGAVCVDVAGGATARQVAMPAMTPGNHALTVQACNVAGCATSDALAVRLVVVPAPATNLRIVAAP